MKKLALIATLFLFWQSHAFALGLGQPKTETTIGDRLLVEIPLIGMGELKPEELKISTADRSIYQKLRMEKSSIDSSLSFEVTSKNEQAVLIIRSKKSISEPAVHFLVLVAYPNGNVLKEVSLMLGTPKP